MGSLEMRQSAQKRGPILPGGRKPFASRPSNAQRQAQRDLGLVLASEYASSHGVCQRVVRHAVKVGRITEFERSLNGVLWIAVGATMVPYRRIGHAPAEPHRRPSLDMPLAERDPLAELAYLSHREWRDCSGASGYHSIAGLPWRYWGGWLGGVPA